MAGYVGVTESTYFNAIEGKVVIDKFRAENHQYGQGWVKKETKEEVAVINPS